MKKDFAKTILIFSLLILLQTPIFAQSDCNLAENTAPLLLNLKIAMSPEQVQGVFGKDLRVKVRKKGARTFFQNYIKKPARGSLQGVRAIYLRFFDGKLYQLEIFYEPRRDLATLEQIRDALSAQLALAPNEWTLKNKKAVIKCGQISLSADNVLNPRIELTDEQARAKVEELRDKK